MTKTVILAGGKGTRISEESRSVPKPMIQLGDRPILQHIIDGYMSQGIHEFIILAGYKSDIICGYFLVRSNSVDKSFRNSITFYGDGWMVTVVESGMETQTGGRLRYLKGLVDDDFFFTYGDGLSNVDIHSVMLRHKSNGAIATISGVRPDPRFGSIVFDDNGRILDFGEKQEHLHGWINGGFAVLSPKILDYIPSDDCNLERDIYPQLASSGELYVKTHHGFWQCVDTLRDLETLQEIYNKNGPIWIK